MNYDDSTQGNCLCDRLLDHTMPAARLGCTLARNAAWYSMMGVLRLEKAVGGINDDLEKSKMLGYFDVACLMAGTGMYAAAATCAYVEIIGVVTLMNFVDLVDAKINV